MRLILLIALCAPASVLAQEPPRITRADTDADSFVLVFDQPMLTWATSAQGTPIRVSPRVDCEWTWDSDTRLRCSAYRGDHRLSLASSYRVHVGSGLWSQTGAPLPPGVIDVESPRPALGLRDVRWKAGRPELELQSGHRLDEAAVRAVLSLQVDGHAVAYGLAADARNQRYGPRSQWRLQPDWPAQGRELVVRLAAGLRAQDGPLPGNEPQQWTFRIDEPFEFAGVACNGQRMRDGPLPVRPDAPCAAEQGPMLLFTSEPDPKQLQALWSVLPDGLEPSRVRGFCYQCNREGRAPLAAVHLRVRSAGQVFSFDLPAGLRDVRGQSLPPARVSLPVADFRPAVALAAEPRLQLPGIVPVDEATGVNLPATATWVDLVVDRGIRRVETPLALDALRNQTTPLPTPALTRALQRRGGFVLSGVRGHLRQTHSIGVAPFHAFVRRDPMDDGRAASVLAWATEWQGAAPVQGLRGEWLSVAPDGQVQVLAATRGDADGVLVFPPTALTEAQRDSLQLIRLRAGRRTVVVPLEPMARLQIASGAEPDDDEAYEDAWGWSDPRRHIAFGVTDRLLYRPGETVRFRVWPRSREDARLQAPRAGESLSLQLRAPEWGEPPVASWTASTDEWGSASGERRLPATLDDGRYCIGTDAMDWDSGASLPGACFQVARFDSQALWASLATSSARVLRPGEILAMDAEAGFYSGGAAAQLPVSWIGLAEAVPFTLAYPDYSRFTFIESSDEEGDPLHGLAVPASFDLQGRAALRVPARLLEADEEEGPGIPTPFVRVRVNATVGLSGQAQAGSPTAEVFVAAHARYVGLRVGSSWLHIGADPELEAVVVGHDGEALAGEAVDVVVRAADANDGAVLARCRLESGRLQSCPFRAPSIGHYVFEASAPGAAPTELTRFVGSKSGPVADGEEARQVASLEAVDGEPGRVRLVQPHARARVLLVVERESVRAVRVAEVGPEAVLDLPADPGSDQAPAVAVRAFVRPADADAEDAFAIKTLGAVLRQAVPVEAPPPPRLSVAREVLAPGEPLVLEVQNPGNTARAFTLAVVDEGMHQQAADLHPGQDPSGPHFLGERQRWLPATLFATEGWEGQVDARRLGLHLGAAGMDTDEPAVVFDEPSPIGMIAQEAPESLDSVEVTGSRISRAAVFEVQKGGGRRDAPAAAGAAAQARVRTRFVETAYWDTALVLAAGESRTLRIPLPDNLTRWRVQAWASGQGTDFARSELTVTTTLPVEVRLGLPTHLYPGDRSQAVVNARLAGSEPRRLEVLATAEGAGAAGEARRAADVAAQASLSVAVPVQPATPGTVTVVGRAQAGDDGDAVASVVPVPSRWADRRMTQLAWLTGEPLRLQSPLLPRGAEQARLALAVDDGLPGLRREWLDGLRDYPHVCWEQQLTRALGAAMALASDSDAARWPDAAGVIEDAFAAAPGFLDDEGHFLFFRDGGAPGEPMLSAYTLRAFGLLESMGHAPPAETVGDLSATLEDFVASEAQRHGRSGDDRQTSFEKEAWVLALAALAEVGGDVDTEHLRRAWTMWDDLSWHARSQLAAALAGDDALAAPAAQALARLREAGERDGARRIVRDPRDFSGMMGSSLRDHCAVAGTLLRLDPQARREGSAHALVRGIIDQYAGGAPGLDTQAALSCLLALRELQARPGDASGALAAVRVQADGRSLDLTDTAEGEGRVWEGPLPAGPITLDTPEAMPPLVLLRADARFRQDQATVAAAGTGMSLRREYRVLRDGRWQAGQVPREGDWVQVVLHLRVPAWRNFVAITDAVPGGWTPRDTSLAGVGTAATSRAGEDDSGWFDARQTGASHVRLYARHLPPGEHRVSYLAQATHPGEFLAPPAVAELMYGGGSHANTAAARVQVLPAR